MNIGKVCSEISFLVKLNSLSKLTLTKSLLVLKKFSDIVELISLMISFSVGFWTLSKRFVEISELNEKLSSFISRVGYKSPSANELS